MNDAKPDLLRAVLEAEYRSLPGREQFYDRLSATTGRPVPARRLDEAFRQAYGLTPFQYLQFLRLQEAQRLLLNPHRTVEEVSYAVGLEGCRPLQRLFARYLGVSPRDFRTRLCR